MRTSFRTLLALSALGFVAATSSNAAAQAPVARQALAVTAQNRTAAAEASKGAARRDDRARPGDVLHYRLTFTNVAGKPVRGVALSNPIPSGLRLVAGTARASRADARAEYSIDGGKTFSAEPAETVVVDGREITRPASSDRYTHVRWTVGEWVAPDAVVTAEFDARLTTPATQSTTNAPDSARSK